VIVIVKKELVAGAGLNLCRTTITQKQNRYTVNSRLH